MNSERGDVTYVRFSHSFESAFISLSQSISNLWGSSFHELPFMDALKPPYILFLLYIGSVVLSSIALCHAIDSYIESSFISITKSRVPSQVSHRIAACRNALHGVSRRGSGSAFLRSYLALRQGQPFLSVSVPAYPEVLSGTSKIRAHAIRVGRVVVVAIPVVVDIAEVRRGGDIPKPPVRAFKGCPH